MKVKFTIVIIAFLVSIVSCSNHTAKENRVEETQSAPVTSVKEVFETGKVIRGVSCKSNPTLSFALYLPSKYDTAKKFPAIIFFDPHAGGEFVVKKYQHLAEEFNFVLIGSNDSKNGLSQDQTNQIANGLINDATSRFSTFTNISLAGFSGGAKVALSAADQHQNISSVIYCGAATPISPNAKFSLLGFAGVSDMNYTDVVSFDQSLQDAQVKHYLIEWNGKHEWPDSATFRNSFYWIDFNSGQPHSSGSGSVVSKFLGENPEPHLTTSNTWNVYVHDTKMISFLKGVTDVFGWEKNADEISKTNAFKKEMQSRAAALQQEQAIKQEYIQEFQTRDIAWWKTEISKLQSQKDPMHQRLLGFISLACYSVSGNSIQQNNFPLAEKMLAIYQLADPKNSDQAFLEACLFTKEGKNDEAIASLQRAVALGLNDPSKITGEPSLQPLINDVRLQELLAKMNH